jgi:hypothetical protein
MKPKRGNIIRPRRQAIRAVNATEADFARGIAALTFDQQKTVLLECLAAACRARAVLVENPDLEPEVLGAAGKFLGVHGAQGSAEPGMTGLWVVRGSAFLGIRDVVKKGTDDFSLQGGLKVPKHGGALLGCKLKDLSDPENHPHELWARLNSKKEVQIQKEVGSWWL